MKYEAMGQELNFWSHPDLPKNPSRIGVSMSGGVDSTMACILIMEEFKDRSITICPAVGEDVNRASNADTVKKILDVLRLRYPQHKIMEPAVYPYDKFSKKYVEKVPMQDHLKIRECEGPVVTGKTIQPPHINIDNRPPGSFVELSKNVYRPFFNINKKMIAYLYDLFDVKMDVYPLTVSCIDMYKHNPVPCKKCDWCQEKKWAFGTYDFGYL